MQSASRESRWPTRIHFDNPAQPNTVGVVTLGAPEAARNKEQFARGLAWLERSGCSVHIAPHALNDHGFLADSPQALADDLNQFIGDKRIDWIMCAGGGYNANSLLPFIDYAAFANQPKPIVGISNMTVVLNALTARSDTVTFHGPAVVWDLGREDGPDAYTQAAFRAALDRPTNAFGLQAEDTWNWPKHGVNSGRLVGGNLWSLQQLLGTPLAPDWSNTILFLEDCFCELHQIKAAIEHFRQAGVLGDISGLIIGIPEGCVENELQPAPTFEEIILDSVRDRAIPVVTGVSLGHTSTKSTLPIGASCTLDSRLGTIVFS